MSLRNIQRAIQVILETEADTFSGVRRAGVATPCYVYEISSAVIDVSVSGIPTECHWTVAVQIEAIADMIDDCLDLIDKVRVAFASPVTDINYDCVLVLSAFSVSTNTATIDDGKTDAERIGTIQLELLVQET